MRTHLTTLTNECTSVPIFADDSNHSERRQDDIKENMRTDCSVGGGPSPNDILNIASHCKVSENQLSLKSNNTNESESGGKENSSAANDAKRNRARNKHPLRDIDCKLHYILKISH